MKKQNPKIKIESIRVEAKTDESPDTSYLGEYTDKESEWAIDRVSGEFCGKIWQRERIMEKLMEIDDTLNDQIKSLFSPDDDEKIKKLENRQKQISNRYNKIRNSGATETTLLHNEYSFFLPSTNHVPHNPRNWDHVKPEDIAKTIKEHGSIKNADLHYAMQDYKRMESLDKGYWRYIGIIAKAVILVPSNVPESAQLQTISSGGLWGIESDSGDDYLQETAREQLDDLAQQLEQLGIGKRAIQYAIKNWNGEIEYK
jgi:hypothetical protein